MRAFVYIRGSAWGNALYVGCTTDLRRRLEQHRAGAADAHTRRYRINRLVWFEGHEELSEAQARERRLKRWRRAWKEALIAEVNPEWRDLAAEVPL